MLLLLDGTVMVPKLAHIPAHNQLAIYYKHKTVLYKLLAIKVV